MAKIYGLFGSMTGKVADVVMAVRNGEQIARKYQPVVSNPNTAAQVASRAKLKLMSQLSTVMAPVIAMPRQGTASSRNMFVKTNYGAAMYHDNQADITLTDIKLTRSVVSLYAMSVSRTQATVRYGLLDNFTSDLARVVYAVFVKNNDNTLRFVESKVVSTPGDNNNFEGSTILESDGLSAVIYAYGVRDNNENARAVFGNMTVLTAETVAKLIVTRTLTERDVTLTETRAIVSAPANANMGNRDDEEVSEDRGI